MLHIHLLHALQHPTTPLDKDTLHSDITDNYHELAVLAGSRWKLGVNPILPFHLAAVEAMRIALDRDTERTDVVSDT